MRWYTGKDVKKKQLIALMVGEVASMEREKIIHIHSDQDPERTWPSVTLYSELSRSLQHCVVVQVYF